MTTAKDESKKYPVCPEGTYPAVCIGVYDIGKQKTIFTNEDGTPKVQHKVIIKFELDERMPEGEYKDKRYNVSKNYTLNLGEKSNLFRDLTSWLGKLSLEQRKQGIELEGLIGKPCLITIGHNVKEDKTYTEIKAISRLVKGMNQIEQETDTTEIPNWIKKLQEQAVKNEVNGEEIPY